MSIADSLLHQSLSNESVVIIEMRFTTCRMDMMLLCYCVKDIIKCQLRKQQQKQAENMPVNK